jgi:GNAT superfamily N-acetyltransferase
MPDMLVNLLNLPPLAEAMRRIEDAGYRVRRAQPFEITPVRSFIEKRWGAGWADETSVGFANKPVTVSIATLEGAVVGFGAYECTRRAFFGPTGVDEAHRKKGVGAALLLACLWGLRDMGYVYGIIGGAGPTEFYQRIAGATAIPGSSPGIYTDLLKKSSET